MTTHRVTIQSTRRTAERQYYKATLDGVDIVTRSSDPAFAACRAMKAKGLSGRVEFYRPGVPYPGLIVHDLDNHNPLGGREVWLTPSRWGGSDGVPAG